MCPTRLPWGQFCCVVLLWAAGSPTHGPRGVGVNAMRRVPCPLFRPPLLVLACPFSYHHQRRRWWPAVTRIHGVPPVLYTFARHSSPVILCTRPSLESCWCTLQSTVAGRRDLYPVGPHSAANRLSRNRVPARRSLACGAAQNLCILAFLDSSGFMVLNSSPCVNSKCLLSEKKFKDLLWEISQLPCTLHFASKTKSWLRGGAGSVSCP
jgi:hypothetical protein